MSQLGGMYANSIRLVGTESGVGVNSVGTIEALTGTLEINQAGDVRIAGGNVQSKGDLTIRSERDISNAGAVYAGGKAAIDARGTLKNTGTLVSGENFQSTVGNLENSGQLGTGADVDGKVATRSDVSVIASGILQNSGQILAGNDLALSGNKTVLDQGKVMAANHALITAGETLGNRQSQIFANTITLSSDGKLDNTDGVVETRTLLTISAPSVDNTRGVIKQTADAGQAGNAPQGIVIKNGKLDTVSASANSQANKTQSILINDQGTIASNSSTTIDVQGISNIDGTVQSKAGLSISGNGDIDNTKGKLLAGDTLNMTAAGRFTNSRGNVTGDQLVSLSSGSDFVNNDGSIQGAAVQLTAASIDNAGGRIVHTGSADQVIQSKGAFNNSKGTFASNAGKITLTSGGINNAQGEISHGGNGQFALTAGGSLDNTHGAVSSNGALAIVAG
ncbi:MAG: hypothetical protein ACREX0_05095, partial [Noviherbaspirillum sp.]